MFAHRDYQPQGRNVPSAPGHARSLPLRYAVAAGAEGGVVGLWSYRFNASIRAVFVLEGSSDCYEFMLIMLSDP